MLGGSDGSASWSKNDEPESIGSMTRRPKLPLEARASIESWRALVRQELASAYPWLFSPSDDFANQANRFGMTGRARLLLQLRTYSTKLFMCEARFYKANAPDEKTLRSWLKRVAQCIENETIQETQVCFARLRCTVMERKREIRVGVKEEADFWVARYREHSAQLLSKATHPVDGTGSAISSEETSGGSPKENNRTAQDTMKWEGNLDLLRNVHGELEPATYETAGQYLGVGIRQIQKLVKSDRLQTTGLGQYRRIIVASLLKYRPANTVLHGKRTEAN
jgi:hypothetical protein